ncbi:hypothetical protein EEO52_12970, partial [Staphylococcus pseudintermedius]|nr:hypothetical protein [Staphylococcus pseudintermedius]
CLADSSILHSLSMMFLFVGASVCVRVPSDSTSQWTPLSFANSSYYQACNGLSPSRCYPCRGHNKKCRKNSIFIPPFSYIL